MEKEIFGQDFSSLENFDFHDCKIYAMGFDESKNEFLVDIDFITEWTDVGNSYVFNLSPSTLVFENAWSIEFNIFMNIDLIIDSVEKSNPAEPRNSSNLPPYAKEYDWTLELLQGQIRLKSTGLKIYRRKEMRQKESQCFSLDERGYISLKKEGVAIPSSSTSL